MREIRQGVALQHKAQGAGGVHHVLLMVLHRQRILQLGLVRGGICPPGMFAIQVERLPGRVAVELVHSIRIAYGGSSGILNFCCRQGLKQGMNSISPEKTAARGAEN